MASIAAQFHLVRDEISNWDAKYDGRQPFEIFKRYVDLDWESILLLITLLFRYLQEQFAKLSQIKHESKVRRVVDFEHEKGRIAEIIENVEQARIRFVVRVPFVRSSICF